MGNARVRWALGVVLALLAPLPGGSQERVSLPTADRLLDRPYEPLWAVGELDGGPWEAFGSLDDAAFGADGRLYLLDSTGRQAVAVDSLGRLAHRVGSEGDGPGEYRSPAGVVALPDRRVVVWDARKRAFLVYGPTGEPLDEIRPDLAEGLPQAPLRLAPDGSVVALAAGLLTGRLGRAYVTANGIESAEGFIPLLRIPLTPGAPAGVVTPVRVPTLDAPPPHPLRRGFEALPSWGPLADGRIALFHSTDYRIEILDSDGRVERVLERGLEARPTTEADRDAYRRRQAQLPTRRLGSGPGSEGRPPDPSDFWFSPVIPPVMAITADGRDRIWVLRRDPADPTRPGPVDILSADGRYLGTLSRDLHASTGSGLPVAFAGERAVFLGRGSYDVPVARVYRLGSPLR